MDGAERLIRWFESFSSCVVAFSGGVDSAVVAKAAVIALNRQATAVTGIGNAVSQYEKAVARKTALQIGISHVELSTAEGESLAYRLNDLKRCYHCKSELYSRLHAYADQLHIDVVVSGTNLDDLGDYRPGLQAASEFGIRHPLVETKLRKSDVRTIASDWGLDVAAKPASPCLASRIAYGVEVTPERLARVEHAEDWLRDRGFRDFRVRIQQDEIARIEINAIELPRIFAAEIREDLVVAFRGLGFARVTLDLEGLQSGSLYQIRVHQNGSS